MRAPNPSHDVARGASCTTTRLPLFLRGGAIFLAALLICVFSSSLLIPIAPPQLSAPCRQDDETRSTVDSLVGRARAVNLLAPSVAFTHHPVFLKFKPYHHTGNITGDFLFDFLGIRTRSALLCSSVYMDHPKAHPLRAYMCGDSEKAVNYAQRPQSSAWPHRGVTYAYPLIGEEYFEYISVLDAAATFQQSATRPFAMIELGCGYCFWLVTAARAAYALHGESTDLFMLGVDGGEEQIANCRAHGDENGVAIKTLNAAVVDGAEPFVTFSHSGSFGASVGGDITVPAVNISAIFARHDVPYIIDILDVDIQGSESVIFASHGALLAARVKRVVIGTHWLPESSVDASVGSPQYLLEKFFSSLGFSKTFAFQRSLMSCVEPLVATEYGPICFADGILSFTNDAL